MSEIKAFENRRPGWFLQAIAAIPLAALFAASLLVMWGFITLGRQLLGWLKTGVWRERNFVDSLWWIDNPDTLHLSWVIPDKALQFVLYGPQSLWLIAIGLTLTLGSTHFYEVFEKWSIEQAKLGPVRLSKRAKITLAALAAWLFAFPTVLCLSLVGFERWSDMFLVGCVLAFYGSFVLNWLADRIWPHTKSP